MLRMRAGCAQIALYLGRRSLRQKLQGRCCRCDAAKSAAKLAATPRFVVVGSSVLVNNISQGHNYADTVISWDIGNDGSIDYTGSSFSHMFSTPGLYDLRLRIQSGLLIDQVIYERFIVVSSVQLPSPNNPVLTREGSDLVFSWDPVLLDEGRTEVPYYIIYKSDTPDGFFQYRGFSTSSLLPFRDFGAANSERAFYFVIGFNGSRAELDQYINNHRTGIGIGRKQSTSE